MISNTTNWTNVYAFSGCKLTLSNGFAFAISVIRIFITENGIPTIRLMLDPAHNASDTTDEAVKATFSELIGIHNQFQTYIQDETTATLELTVDQSSDAAGADTQALNIKDWIVTASGLSGMSGDGELSVEVELQHPIWRLAKTIPSFGKIKANTVPAYTQYSNTTTFTNPMNAVSETLKIMADLPREIASEVFDLECAQPYDASYNGSLTDDKLIKIYASLLKDAKAAFDKHIVWGTGASIPSWPMEACWLAAPAETGGIKHSIPNYLVNNRELNLYNILVFSLCPAFGLSLLPVFTEPALIVRPFNPWAKPEIEIRASDISQLTQPGSDPQPIAGTRLDTESSERINDYSVYVLSEGSIINNKLWEIYYIPKQIVDGEKPLVGIIPRVAAPPWLFAALRARTEISMPKPEPANTYTVNQNADMLGVMTDNTSADIPKRKDLLAGTLLLVAAQEFFRLYRSQVQISLRCRLMIQYNSGSDILNALVIPGCVVTVKDDDDTQAIEFYATEVRHEINVRGKTAHTEIAGRYVRPPGGIPGVVETPTDMPYWRS
jgi:hypothetical protein